MYQAAPPEKAAPDPYAPVAVELGHANWAALLAWLCPGAGHLYQRRYAKSVLFMVCILGTYFFGLSLAGGHTVYASFHKEDYRLQYICQLGVGLPALPAVVQATLVRMGHKPLWNGVMAPPRTGGKSELAEWHKRWPQSFEMGTLFTVVAGLLNVLAIYDAHSGPVYATEESSKKPKQPPEPETEKGA